MSDAAPVPLSRSVDLQSVAAFARELVAALRQRPGVEALNVLRAGVHVMYADPHVPVLATDTLVLRAQPQTDELVSTADCVVVITHHRDFDYDRILRHARLIVDTRNAFKNAQPNGGTVIRL